MRRRATLALGRLVCTVGCGEYYVPPRAVTSVLRAPCHVMGRAHVGRLPARPLSACARVVRMSVRVLGSRRRSPLPDRDADTHDSRRVPRHKNHPTHSSYRREARSSDERVVSRQFSCRFSFFVFVGTTRTHRATAINRTALICAQPRAPAACNSSATLSRTLHTVVCVVASLSRTRSDALRSSRLPLLSDLTRLHGRCVARRLRHGWWCFQE